MYSMKELVKEFEGKYWNIVGDKAMPKFKHYLSATNYIVRYLTNDESGSIFIVATDDDRLVISFVNGNLIGENEIFATRFIKDYNKARQSLEILKNTIGLSAYEGYNVTIEEYADRFQKDYFNSGCGLL